MAIGLILIGLMLISIGVQGTQTQFGALVKSDFSGAGSFWYFIVGIFIVGAIGYYQPMQGVSRLIIVLLVLVLLLTNGGFWSQLQAAIASSGIAPGTAPAGPPVAPNSGGVGGGLGSLTPGFGSNSGATPVPSTPGIVGPSTPANPGGFGPLP